MVFVQTQLDPSTFEIDVFLRSDQQRAGLNHLVREEYRHLTTSRVTFEASEEWVMRAALAYLLVIRV